MTLCYAHHKRSDIAGEIIGVQASPAGASGIEVVNIFFSCTVATHTEIAETTETVTMPARRRPARYPSTRVPGVVLVAIIGGREGWRRDVAAIRRRRRGTCESIDRGMRDKKGRKPFDSGNDRSLSGKGLPSSWKEYSPGRVDVRNTENGDGKLGKRGENRL